MRMLGPFFIGRCLVASGLYTGRIRMMISVFFPLI
jgi:hypothetical protein